MSEEKTVVWAEIPVQNLDQSISFYQNALGYEFKKMSDGDLHMASWGDDAGIHGHLVERASPANTGGCILHLRVSGPLPSAMQSWRDHGGKIVSEPITIPQGTFCYGMDLDGNAIGLFEPKAA